MTRILRIVGGSRRAATLPVAFDGPPEASRAAADYFVVKQSETANSSEYACSIRRL
jgi:hypothetical protein